jgi:hypothetical protein
MKRAQRRKIHKREVYQRSRAVRRPIVSWFAGMPDYDEGCTFVKQIQSDFLTGGGLPPALLKKDA